MGANDPQGGAIFDPRGMVGRIYKEDHYTLLQTKYESFGLCGFGEEDFSVLPMGLFQFVSSLGLVHGCFITSNTQ